MRRTIVWGALSLAGVLGVLGILAYRGSAETFPDRNPIGERFPTAVGQSLQKETKEIPADFVDPTVLLIGYKQNAQFDIDRWIMGLLQTEVPMQIVEVPTIPGLLPSFASGWIDEGMRSGIPREDWGSVITLYDDAARPVAAFTGTERGHIARVIVLDRQGTVVWFDDAGYSARKAMAVAQLGSGLD